jgi:hypothetical protein
MKSRREIQELIPSTHRDLIEVVPRGFARSALIGGLLLGAVGGAMLTFVMPAWLTGATVATLFVLQRIHAYRSDRLFDRRMADLEARDLDWKPEEES